jgi:hypothetical protein
LGRPGVRYRPKPAALVVCACFRVSIEGLEGCWLTFSPFALKLFARALGSLALRPPGSCRLERGLSSLALPPTSAGFPESLLRSPKPHADTGFRLPLLASPGGPSTYDGQIAPFSTAAEATAFGSRARRPKGSALRVWLPSRRFWPHLPSKAFFSFQRSWASSLQSFSPAGDPRKCFHSPLRSYAFLPDPLIW